VLINDSSLYLTHTEQVRAHARVEQLKIVESERRLWFDRTKQVSDALSKRISGHMAAERRQNEIQAESQREQEQLLGIEAEMQIKILGVRATAEDQAEWETEIKMRKEALTAKREVQIESWKTKDELARQEITGFQQEQTRLTAHRDKLRIRAEFAQEALATELDNERKLMQLQRERSVRMISQAATLAQSSHEELVRERDDLLAKLESDAKDSLLNNDRHFRAEQQGKREHYLSLEKKKATAELALHQQRTYELQQRQLRIEFEDKLRDYHSEQKLKALEAEQKASNEVLDIKQSSHDREFELNLLLQEQQKKERLGYQHILHEAAQRVMLTERTRLARMRNEMETDMQDAQDHILTEHHKQMHALMQDREQQLYRMNEATRTAELKKVETEHLQHQARLSKMRDWHEQEEANLQARLTRLNAVLQNESSSEEEVSSSNASPATTSEHGSVADVSDISNVESSDSSEADDGKRSSSSTATAALTATHAGSTGAPVADSSIMRRLRHMQRQIDETMTE
jgi:hypothetical protein